MTPISWNLFCSARRAIERKSSPCKGGKRSIAGPLTCLAMLLLVNMGLAMPASTHTTAQLSNHEGADQKIKPGGHVQSSGHDGPYKYDIKRAGNNVNPFTGFNHML